MLKLPSRDDILECSAHPILQGTLLYGLRFAILLNQRIADRGIPADLKLDPYMVKPWVVFAFVRERMKK